MRHGILIAWLSGLWLFLWSLDFSSQRDTGRPFGWPDASLGNPLVAVPFYLPPFAILGLALWGRRNELAEFIFVTIARTLLVVVILAVASMMFLNAIIR